MPVHRLFIKISIFINLFLIILILVSSSFSAQKNPRFTWEIIDKLGRSQGDAPDVFYQVVDIAVDSIFNFYVLDKGKPSILCFDSTGRHIRSISLSKGEGPGEVLFPRKLALTPYDEVALLDPQLRRVYFFRQTGKEFRAIKLPETYPVGAAVDFKIDKEGKMWITHKDLENYRALHIYTPDGKYEESLLRIEPLNLGISMPLIFTGYFDWYNNNIIFMKETPYLVTLYDRAESILLDFEVDESMTQLPKVIKKGAGFILPGYNRATFLANLDDQFVITQYYDVTQKKCRFDLYDIHTGKHIATRKVPSDIALELLAVKGNKLYGVRTTDDMVELLIVKVKMIE